MSHSAAKGFLPGDAIVYYVSETGYPNENPIFFRIWILLSLHRTRSFKPICGVFFSICMSSGNPDIILASISGLPPSIDSLRLTNAFCGGMLYAFMK